MHSTPSACSTRSLVPCVPWSHKPMVRPPLLDPIEPLSASCTEGSRVLRKVSSSRLAPLLHSYSRSQLGRSAAHQQQPSAASIGREAFSCHDQHSSLPLHVRRNCGFSRQLFAAPVCLPFKIPHPPLGQQFRQCPPSIVLKVDPSNLQHQPWPSTATSSGGSARGVITATCLALQKTLPFRVLDPN